jgi:IS5 family transposase
MLRLTSLQRDFWDDLLPEAARRLSPELQAIDAFLDDERFLAPFVARFPSKRGRQTIPMETYLRLMYLKMRYQLGYETLVAEVTDSVGWRRFCRISLSGRVPDASTVIKLTNGPCQGLAQDVHAALIQKLTERKILRGRKVRVDTTVVEADIHYPTDAQLLADGVRVVTRTVKQLQRLGAEIGGEFRDVGRSVKTRLLGLGKGLKQDDGVKKQATRARVTAEVLRITEPMMRRATCPGAHREVGAEAGPGRGSAGDAATAGAEYLARANRPRDRADAAGARRQRPHQRPIDQFVRSGCPADPEGEPPATHGVWLQGLRHRRGPRLRDRLRGDARQSRGHDRLGSSHRAAHSASGHGAEGSGHRSGHGPTCE